MHLIQVLTLHIQIPYSKELPKADQLTKLTKDYSFPLSTYFWLMIVESYIAGKLPKLGGDVTMEKGSYSISVLVKLGDEHWTEALHFCSHCSCK